MIKLKFSAKVVKYFYVRSVHKGGKIKSNQLSKLAPAAEMREIANFIRNLRTYRSLMRTIYFMRLICPNLYIKFLKKSKLFVLTQVMVVKAF